MKFNIFSKRTLTLKFIVGSALLISMLSMAIILVIGFIEIRKNTEEIQTNEEQLAETSPIPQSTVQKAGGEDGKPQITLTLTPEKVAPGESATIDWNASDADSCEASGAWSGPKNTVGNQNSGAIEETKEYTLVCTNSNGATEIKVAVTVDPNLSANQNNSSSPDSTTSNTATSSSGGSSGGSSSSSPSGSGSGGSVAPVVTFTVSPGSINEGSSATLSWTTNGNASPTPNCNASGSWSGGKSTSGNESTSPAAGNYAFTLTCSSSAGSDSKTVNLTVNAVSTCGSGGSCTSAEVASHNTQSNCWVIIKYTASGGNGANGQVYKIDSGFFGSSGNHNSLPSAPSLSASSYCGKNISSTFNNKHSGGSRSDGSNNAIWWLTNNGNSLIGPYSGS